MSPLDESIWGKLSEHQLVSGSLRARSAFAAGPNDLFVAVDAAGMRHVIVPYSDSDGQFLELGTQGLKLELRQLMVNDEPPTLFVDLICLDPSGYPAFNVLVSEIAKTKSSEPISTVDCVLKVVERWRRFWSIAPTEALSVERQVGLFAEIWFLLYWVLPEIGPKRAVEIWKGPIKSRHDFEWPRRAIEVKASTLKRGRIHRIHGLDQLNPPEDGMLWLFSLSIRKEGSATNSLPAIVSRCRDVLKEWQEVLTDFDDLLLEAGYSDFHVPIYVSNTFRISSEALFEVSPKFPRLTVDMFATSLPSEIENIEYELNLNGCDDCLVAREPSEAKDLGLFSEIEN